MSLSTTRFRSPSRRMRAATAALVAFAGLAFATTVNAAPLPSFMPLVGCTVNWDGGAGTSRWHDAANWDTDTLPGSSDRVCIPATAPGSTVIFVDPVGVEVASLMSGKPLYVGGGQLTLTGDSSVAELRLVAGILAVSSATLTVETTMTHAGGELRGAGTVSVVGGLLWSGGSETGAGVTEVLGAEGIRIEGDGELSVSGQRLVTGVDVTWAGEATVSLDDSVLQAQHRLLAASALGAVSGGTLNVGDELIVRGAFGVDGRLDAPGADVSIDGAGAQLALRRGGLVANDFDLLNGGSVFFGGAEQTEPFEVAGTIRGAGGGVVVTGDVVVEEGYEAGSTLVNSGSLKLPTGAKLGKTTIRAGKLAAPGATSAASLEQNAGEVVVSDMLAIAGRYTWTAGTLAGSGATEVAGPFELPADGERTLREGILALEGTATVAGGRLDLDHATVSSAHSFVVGGSSSVFGTGRIDIQGALDVDAYFNVHVPLDVDPAATVRVRGDSAVLDLYVAGDHEGTYRLENGGSISVNGGQHVFKGTLAGEAGSLQVHRGADVEAREAFVLRRALVDEGTLHIPAGAVVQRLSLYGGAVETAGALSLDTLEQEAGELRGTGTLTVNGSVAWSGGRQSGSGTTVVASTAAFDLAPNEDDPKAVELARALRVEGSLHLHGDADVQVGAGQTLLARGPALVDDGGGSIGGLGTFALDGDLRVQGAPLALDAGIDARAGSSVEVTGEGAEITVSADSRWDGEVAANVHGAISLDDGVQTFSSTSKVDGMAGGYISTDGNAELVVQGVFDVEQVWLLGARATIDAPLVNVTRLLVHGPLALETGTTLVVHESYENAEESETTLASGSVLEARGSAKNLQGALLDGFGTIRGTLENGGEIQPGSAAAKGTLRVTGNFHQLGTGSLRIRATPAAHDELVVDGTAELGGTLDLELDPALAAEVAIVRPFARVGEFENVRADDCGVLRYESALVLATTHPCVSVESTQATEAHGPLVFPVTLSRAGSGTVSIAWEAVGGTAAPGEDFRAGSGLLVLAAGQTHSAIRLPVLDDDEEEPATETMTVRLTSVTGARFRTPEATGTIVDDDGGNADRDLLFKPQGVPTFGDGQYPQAISHRSIVGYASTGFSTYVAWGWRFDLGQGGALAGLGSAYDINEAGDVAGNTDLDYDDSVPTKAVIRKNSGIVELPPIPGYVGSGYALGINDDDWVVGNATRPGGDGRRTTDPVLWRADGSTAVLAQSDDGAYGEASDVNNKGWIIGHSLHGNREVGWVWRDGSLTELGTIGTFSRPFGINEFGEIVGWSGDWGAGHAFVWRPNGGLVDLGAGSAFDINEKHQIVGSAADIGAVLWQADGRRLDLNRLIPAGSGWFLAAATAINDDGVIAGVGSYQGRETSFVLKPLDCTVCVTELTTEQYTYSTRQFVETDTTTDGNQVQITATLDNESSEPKLVKIAVVDPDTGEQLGEDVEDVTLAPDETTTVRTLWDTDGSAWKDGEPRTSRTIRVKLTDPDGRELGDRDRPLKIVPRPVLLVHGLWGGPSDWAGYPALLQQVNPDWYAFPVGGLDGLTIEQNAETLGAAVENVRNAREAWRVDLVAHDTGGLASRAYVQAVMSSLSDGKPSVAHLVMLGTPNWGTPCAWLLPVATAFELRPEVAAAFNHVVTDRRGVVMSSAAGETSPTTCVAPFAGDGLVPVASALTGYDRTGQYAPLGHGEMTGSAHLFSDFVRPQLVAATPAQTFAPGLATFGAAAAPTVDFGEQPQLLDTTTVHLGPGHSDELWIDGRDGIAVGAAFLAPGTVRATLRDDWGHVVATVAADSTAGLSFRTLRAETGSSESFWLTLQNTGTTAVDFPLSQWVENASVKLEAAAWQSSARGRVRVQARLTSGTAYSATAELVRAGAAPVTLHLSDDGLHGDGAADDGLFSDRTAVLPAGDYTVTVTADSSTAHRVVTRAARVLIVSPPPPNTPPVPTTPDVETMANRAVDIHLTGTDADDDDVTVLRAGNPQHGLLTGSGADVRYAPSGNYVGPDSFTYTVDDGLGKVTGTVKVNVTRRSSQLVFQGPNEAREGTTVSFGAYLGDAYASDKPITAGPLTAELDGEQLPVVPGAAEGLFSATKSFGTGVRTATLVLRFPGDALHLPIDRTVEIPVKANRPPVAVGIAEDGVQRGEAGYTTRFFANVTDPDGNLVKIEWDFDGDGSYDKTFAPADSKAGWTTVFPAAFSGTAHVRATDVLGLTAVGDVPVEIAPHRPLGPLSRITFAGERIIGSTVSEDGRWVLFDKPRNDGPITGLPSELFVLDRESGTDERVAVLPDGTAARDHISTIWNTAEISADGRYVAFTLGAPVSGLSGQVYLRDRQAGTTEVASVNAARQNANGYSYPVAISPDGRYVLINSRATNLDPRTTLGCSGCENLFVRDRTNGTTTLASLGSDGKPAGTDSLTGGISADGRYIVFASSLKAVPEKTTSQRDVFVRDLVAGTTVRVSVGPGGAEANGLNSVGTISDRGRFVVFTSEASNLVAGDGNGRSDVFRYDRDSDEDGVYDEAGATAMTRVSVAAAGAEANQTSAFARTNCDGSVITFWSTASNLVPGDGNDEADTFVRDLRAGTTTRVSVEPRDGIEGDGTSLWADVISPDGRYVYFASDAQNLVPGDVNGLRDYFVYDRGTSVDCWHGQKGSAPAAAADAYATDEEVQLIVAAPGVLANDSDADGDPIHAEVAAAPAHGMLALHSDGSFTYTPEPGRHGVETFTYRALDADGKSAPATVTLTVRAANHAPVAVGSETTTDEDTSAPVVLGGTDADGDPLTIEIVEGPHHGTLAGTAYRPAANWNGTDTIRFLVRDGASASAPATATVVVRPVNDAPTVTLDIPVAIDEGGAAAGLTATAADVDGDPLAFAWQAPGGTIHGAGPSVELAADDGPGAVAVTVRVSDGSLDATASRSIEVRNVAPTATAPVSATAVWGLQLPLAGTVADASAADRAAGLQPRWTFGDRGSADGASVEPRFDAPGSFAAVLTAKDKDGATGSATTQATITKRPTTLALTATDGGAIAELRDGADGATARLAGRTVVFRVDSGDVVATTDASGRAALPLDQPLPPGPHTVAAAFAEDDLYLGSGAAPITVTVTAPGSGGKVTGGLTLAAGKATFVVNGDGATLKGNLSWAGYEARAITSLAVAPDERSAWFTGTGVDGRPFIAYVFDGGEPSSADVFRLWIGGTLVTGDGVVLGGNLQIHKSK